MSLTTYRRLLLGTLAFGFCGVFSALGQNMNTQVTQYPLKIELTATKTMIHAGEPLTLRITIWNKGTADLLVRRSVEQEMDRLSFYLTHGRETDTTRVVGVGDNFSHGETGEALARLVCKYFILLGPGKFYGNEIVLDSKDFPRLRIPGTYQIKGQYASIGFRELGLDRSTINWPYTAWEGRIDTNSIWITVKSDKLD